MLTMFSSSESTSQDKEIFNVNYYWSDYLNHTETGMGQRDHTYGHERLLWKGHGPSPSGHPRQFYRCKLTLITSILLRYFNN